DCHRNFGSARHARSDTLEKTSPASEGFESTAQRNPYTSGPNTRTTLVAASSAEPASTRARTSTSSAHLRSPLMCHPEHPEECTSRQKNATRAKRTPSRYLCATRG